LQKAELAPGLARALAGQHRRLSLLAANAQEEAAKPEPPAEERQVEKLRALLVQAAPVQQEVLLAQLRDSPAPGAAKVLAGAVEQLKEPQRGRAQQYLAQRLARLPAEGVAALLEDKGAAWRQAAAQACALQRRRAHVPALIGLLRDDDEDVAQAAHRALRSLTGRDFGPAAGALESQRDRAVAAWRAWWDKQSKGKPKR
jgi:hypothetical protein